MKNIETNTHPFQVDFARLAESIPGHVYWKDQNSIILGCNELQAKSLGYQSKEELAGRTGSELIWQGLPQAERQRQTVVNTEIDKSVMSSGIASCHEEVITTLDGAKNYLINRIPLKDSSNHIIGVLSIAIETAESKNAEKKSLKKKKAPAPENGLAQQQIPLEDPERPPLKILLIEDNMIASKTAQTLLESLQHEVAVANNGVEAISLFEPNKYDIVFTDVGLPDLDGYKLTEQFRKMEKDAQTDPVPIVALTAHEFSSISGKATASGMNAILTKPLLIEEVNKIMNQFVYNEAKAPPAATAPKAPPPTATAVAPTPHIATDTASTSNRYARKSIDLEEGAKILGHQDLAVAQQMLEALIASLPESRLEIVKAFRDTNYPALREVVHKFYGGLCYVGVPMLRQAGKELEVALVKQEHHQVNRLYQRLLDEMSMVEKEFATFKSG